MIVPALRARALAARPDLRFDAETSPADGPRPAQHALVGLHISACCINPDQHLIFTRSGVSFGWLSQILGSIRSLCRLCDRLIYASQSCTENARLCRQV